MNKKFTIDVEMEERWIPHFLSMLKEMEHYGKIGRSRLLAFYADGDGDFHPKFNFSIPFEKVEKKRLNKEYVAKHLDDFYDAG